MFHAAYAARRTYEHCLADRETEHRSALSKEGWVLNKATAGQMLAAARVELERIRRHLIVCRNRHYRDTGHYDDNLAAAIARVDFLLYDIMAGIVSPVDRNAGVTSKTESTRIQ